MFLLWMEGHPQKMISITNQITWVPTLFVLAQVTDSSSKEVAGILK